MTREEAIAYGKRVIDLGLNDETQAFCELAIKALEQRPCEDAISRDMALEKMADYVASGYADSAEDFEEYSRIICQLPPVNPQEPKWIPVSERLPEDKQAVLVWCPQYKNIYCAYLEKEQWWIFGAFVQIVPNEVVAWMPLPEPYKVEPQERSDKE